MEFKEIYDQAELMFDLKTGHLNSHIGRHPDINCEFCKHFIIPDLNKNPALESWKMIIYDLNEIEK